MKKTTIIIIFISLLVSCSRSKKNDFFSVSNIKNPASADKSNQKDIENLPVITFEKTEHNFGKVTQGERVSFSFKFTNTGKTDLIIIGSQSTCGCTTSIPPKEPIRPGKGGEITVTFNSKDKEAGKIDNGVVIEANTYPVHTVLKISAEVIIPTK